MQQMWTHYKLSTGEGEVAVLGEFLGRQRHGLAAVSQFAGDEEADGSDQLELRRSYSRTELNQQTINTVHSEWKHAVVTVLGHTQLHTMHSQL